MASSEGWICRKPAPIQRLAPLTVGADAEHGDQQEERDAEQDRRQVADRLQPVAGDRCMITRPTAPNISVRFR